VQRSRRASSRPRSWSADLVGELALPAGTRERYRFSLWEPRKGEPGWESLAAAYVAARRLALGYLTFGPMLTLVGEPGVGKTHLALAIAWEWVERFEQEPWAYLSTGDIRAQLEHKLEERRRYRWSLNGRWWRLKYPEDPGVRFARAGELLDRLRRGYEDGAYYSLLEECQRCRLLVLDDLGHQGGAAPAHRQPAAGQEPGLRGRHQGQGLPAQDAEAGPVDHLDLKFLRGELAARDLLAAPSPNGHRACPEPGRRDRLVHRDGGLSLFHGDARDMRELPGGSVDLVITDPPFNVSFSNYGGGVDDSVAPELYARWTREWLVECLRVLKPGGQLYAIMPLKWAPWWQWEIRDLWTKHRGHVLSWNKTMAHLHREKTYIRAWEPILWLTKGGAPAVFRRSYRFEDDKDWFIGTNAIAEAESLRLVKKHPTPRPAWVYEYFVLRASEPGMVVLDPMSGSGTGAAVARKLGRRFVGYDINREYVELAARRVAQMPLGMEEVAEDVAASFRQLELLLKWQGIAQEEETT
jgi:DNA modification methylase